MDILACLTNKKLNLTCSRVSVRPCATPWSRLVRWPQTGAKWVFVLLSPTTPSTRPGLNSYARGRIRPRTACMKPAVKLSPWRQAERGSDFIETRWNLRHYQEWSRTSLRHKDKRFTHFSSVSSAQIWTRNTFLRREMPTMVTESWACDF